MTTGEQADMVSYYHGINYRCPVTGLDAPGRVLWTLHARPGCYNACAACADPREVPTLRELDDARRNRRRRP